MCLIQDVILKKTYNSLASLVKLTDFQNKFF